MTGGPGDMLLPQKRHNTKRDRRRSDRADRGFPPPPGLQNALCRGTNAATLGQKSRLRKPVHRFGRSLDGADGGSGNRFPPAAGLDGEAAGIL